MNPRQGGEVTVFFILAGISWVIDVPWPARVGLTAYCVIVLALLAFEAWDRRHDG